MERAIWKLSRKQVFSPTLTINLESLQSESAQKITTEYQNVLNEKTSNRKMEIVARCWQILILGRLMAH